MKTFSVSTPLERSLMVTMIVIRFGNWSPFTNYLTERPIVYSLNQHGETCVIHLCIATQMAPHY